MIGFCKEIRVSVDCISSILWILLDKYVLQRFYCFAHHLYKDVVLPGGVIDFHHFIQLIEFLGERPGNSWHFSG